MDADLLLRILIQVPALVLAVSFHESAHAWSADRLGDPTGRMMGRVTMNPLRHIDPIGSILVPLVLVMTAGFAFGWAKPVPVNHMNLGHVKRDAALVAAAGPASNLLFALGAAMMVRVWMPAFPHATFLLEPLFTLCAGLIWVNIALAVFNMFPLPPLDGSWVAASLMPDEWAERYLAIGQYGSFILILLIADPMRWGIFHKTLGPITTHLVTWSFRLAGL
ncbi:MAG: site-2 protease family protein [Deltaproteobacteria bacterium]|nr:site-2 protease family protein [Deltaproteobacteria bacterium]